MTMEREFPFLMSNENRFQTILDLSTVHLPDSNPQFGDVRSQAHECGWIVWVSTGEKVEEWFRPIMDEARLHHCILILFDRDAGAIDKFKSYNW